jgi:2,3-bisphosphoglycerate-dependent phosphoglycerate mutase
MELYLVRHGESEANVNKQICKELPDHAIGLNSFGNKGFLQAQGAGRYLADEFRAALAERQGQLRIRMWNSPYRRTRQTADVIDTELRRVEVRGFRPSLDRREEIALVEQQFGLFDGHTDEELAEFFPKEAAHYDKCEKFEGRFWARMPLGESRFDVALRVKSMFGTLVRDYEKHKIDKIVIVSHGVTIRAFIMQWCHETPEWSRTKEIRITAP